MIPEHQIKAKEKTDREKKETQDKILKVAPMIYKSLGVVKSLIDPQITEPKDIRDIIYQSMYRMYKHMLGRAEHEGDSSFTRKLLHELYKADPEFPDPRPLFSKEVQEDWYTPTTDESKLCVIEIDIKAA